MSDADLVQKVRSGEVEAFSALVERHQARVVRLCYHVCGNGPDAESLAHDAFVEAYLNLEALKDPGRFGAWLRTVALNRCRAWYRANRREDAPLDDETVPAAEIGADFASIYLGLAQLSASHRMILVLHYWERLTYEEVAAFLDIPLGTVMSRLYRAREELRKRMETEPKDEIAPPEDFKAEVEAELRLLRKVFRTDPEARERLSLLLMRSPERLIQLIREANESQTLADLVLLLPRLGASGIETTMAAVFGTDPELRVNAERLLQGIVTADHPSLKSNAASPMPSRGTYMVLDRLIELPLVPAEERAALVLRLMTTRNVHERTLLLLVNTLLGWPDAAMSGLLGRFWAAPTSEDLRRSGDVVHTLCRFGTRFAAELVPALKGMDERRRAIASYGAEMLARTLSAGEVAADEALALDGRFRRKWAMPLLRDRDPQVLRELAEAVAALVEIPGLEERAVRTLGYLGDRASTPTLMWVARSDQVSLSLVALRALADVADPDAVDFLIEAAQAADPAERRLAVEALGRIGDRCALAALVDRIADPDVEVRRAALFALREVGGEDAEATIREVNRSDPPLREASARILATLKRRDTPPKARGFRMEDRIRGDATPGQNISVEAALRAIPEDREFPEPEITRRIATTCADYATTRRNLVDEGLVHRENGRYRLSEAGRVVWRVERFILGFAVVG